MKILKNLFGDNTKIHADEIIVGTSLLNRLLGASVIVESGTNANGSYVKYGDGTMICYARKIYDGNVLGTSFNFPASFHGSANVELFAQVEGVISGGPSVLYACEKVVDNVSTYRVKCFAVGTSVVNLATAGETVVSIQAIGRWKA